MTAARLLLRGLTYHRRAHLAVILGVFVATAVITGALILGDSLRASLRQLTLRRLQRVEYVVQSPLFFREALADGAGDNGITCAPAVFVPGTLTHAMSRVNKVAVCGVDKRAWALIQGATDDVPRDREAVLNQRAASELQVKVGDKVSLRMEIPASIPRDALLGDREQTVAEVEMIVKVIAAEGSGPDRFGLFPSQQRPLSIFVDLPELQTQLSLAAVEKSQRNPESKLARVNVLLFGSEHPEQDRAELVRKTLRERVELSDLGMRLVPNPQHGYLSVESPRMMLDNDTVAAINEVANKHAAAVSPVFVHLLDEVDNPDHPEKYSMYPIIAGLEMIEKNGFEKLPMEVPQSDAKSEISVFLDDWLAEDLQLNVGDNLRAKYHQVGPRGELPIVTKNFKIAGIVPLAGAAADRGLTPFVAGITDADKIQNWREPFPIDRARVTDRDHEYWDHHRTTPKLFLPLAEARSLWQNRYGGTTSVRIAPLPSAEEFAKWSAELVETLNQHGSGLVIREVRREGLQAANGTTDFSGLFFGFSFFLVVAAAVLVQVQFRLGIDRRSREIGLMQAVGWTWPQIFRQLFAEGAVVALCGGALGCVGAVIYARTMLLGLSTWWVGAVGTRELVLDVRPTAILVGFCIAVAVALISIVMGLRQLRLLSSRQLLTGVTTEAVASDHPRHWLNSQRISWAFGAISIILLVGALLGLFPAQEAFSGITWQAVAFFLTGMTTLAAGLALFAALLRREDRTSRDSVHWMLTGIDPLFPVMRLGLRNASRNPRRSLLTCAMISGAAFLIVAVAAGRRNPAVETPQHNSGNGGFTLVAESSTPILFDLNTQEGRAKLGLQDQDVDQALTGVQIVPFRVQPGEDASCLNLFQTSRPTILGVPDDVLKQFAEEKRFKFIGTGAQTPWEILNQTPAKQNGAIPVFGDMNTLMYSLHKGPGDQIDLQVREQTIPLQIAGMLDGSVFQGVLLMSESNFFKLFPDRPGFQYFLLDIPNAAQATRVSQQLESKLADVGFDAEPVAERLAAFLSVQNTYLSVFAALGGMGLLLGTVGLGSLMLRNVVERRNELGLLQAIGFSRRKTTGLILSESAGLLLAALSLGTLAALTAMFPHLRQTGADLPLATIPLLLITVTVTGLLATAWAVRSSVAPSVLELLKGE